MRLRRERDRGASSLELAIIAPVFLLLIFFTIQAGLYFYGRTVAVQAAREGVSQLRLAETQEDYVRLRAGAESYVLNFAGTVGGPGLLETSVESAYDDAQGRVSVQVTGRVQSLVPWVEMTTTAESSGTVERFREPEDRLRP